MAQSTASLRSQSSHHSSLSSSHRKDQPDADVPIDVLISYLVAAKRSLSSIHLVHRATTVLSEARTTIELTAALIARTKYLQRSLSSQLKILRGIQFEVEGAVRAVKVEIQTLLAELERVDQGLQDNIQLLKATKIEQGFKDARANFDEYETAVAKDTLHDFVDDQPVEDLKTNIQSAIDEVEAAETKIDLVVRALEDDLQSINALLDNDQNALSSSSSSSWAPPRISQTLKNLESHAHEMAVSLESLVRHFDLCVTAIKHTEGAGALVAKAVNTDDLPEGVDVDDLTAPVQDLSREERSEMLTVLSNDAAEVEEVVIELQDRGAEMEGTLDLLLRWRARHQTSYTEVQNAFNLLEKLSARLPSFVAEITTFKTGWQQSAARISDGQNAIAELSDVYTRFLDSYDGLIVETARRRAVKKQMLKIVNEAHLKIEQLYDEDFNEREVFRNERGDFLPSDIWSGLGDLPSRWAIVRVDGTNQGDAGNEARGEESIPELPRRTVEGALRRLRRKIEGEVSTAASRDGGSASRSGSR